MAGSWVDSTRQMPPGWARIRQQILERDSHRCTWHTDGTRCDTPATDVDHIGNRDDHHPANLRSLCAWHHKRRTAQQGNAARTRLTERRPPEAHPGLRR